MSPYRSPWPRRRRPIPSYLAAALWTATAFFPAFLYCAWLAVSEAGEDAWRRR